MVKQGGISYNNSFRSKKGVNSRHRCQHCGREYKMEWAKQNHENDCRPDLLE